MMWTDEFFLSQSAKAFPLFYRTKFQMESNYYEMDCILILLQQHYPARWSAVSDIILAPLK